MVKKSNFPYLHGFSEVEQNRLRQQASFAEYSVYRDIDFSSVKNLLEVGCGVGAQSEIILRRFPNLHLTGIDLNEKQLSAAQSFLKTLPYAQNRFEIKKMNAQDLEFDANSFDGAFLCWVLEHIPDPAKVLNEVRRVLTPGAKVYISEVMNHSFFLDPYSPNVWKYWMAFNDYQYEKAGDPFIGAKLGNLLVSMGYRDIKTKVKTWHFDNRNPEQRRKTITYWSDLLMSGAEQLIKENVVTEQLVEDAKNELKNVANDPNAIFFYSWMQAQATVF
jgi:ubiquinone/menaquinone biosynthesis C-methylase UbiE